MSKNGKFIENRKTALDVVLDFSPVIGVIIGLCIGAIFVAIWGISPGVFFKELFIGAFGSVSNLGVTLTRATPLLIIGVGTSIAFRAGANNVGQEGQMFLGGLAAAVVALSLPNLTGALGIPLVFIAAMAFGMAFAGIAVLFRLMKGVNELLTTLLLNYIGTLIVSTMVNGPMAADRVVSYPQTNAFGSQYLLTVWPKLGYMHSGIFIALAVAIIFGYFLWRTPSGLQLRTVGLSPLAAKTAGGNPTKVFILAMLASGALCGLAGAVEVLGCYDSLRQGFGTALGFDGLAVALLGNTNPVGVLPAGLFFGALRAGMQSMQRSIGIPSVLLDLIKGTIMVSIMAGQALKMLLLLRSKKPKLSKKNESVA